VSTESRPASLTEYLTSGYFVEAASRTCDSEFLQMGMLRRADRVPVSEGLVGVQADSDTTSAGG
jgi:hypothetical protein